MDNEHNEGGTMKKKEEEIYQELLQTMERLHIPMETARSVNAIKMVQDELSDFSRKIDDIVSLFRDLAVAEYDRDSHGVTKKKEVLRKHGLVK